MQFEFGKAPMIYVENVPAYKAGEWPGLVSCKFGPTRKVIRPRTEGIIFNEKEPIIPPKKRVYSQAPSMEKEFKPCLKIIKPMKTGRDKSHESLKVIRPAIIERKARPEKRHYFQYKDEYIRRMQNKEKHFDNKQQLNEEFKVLSKMGFTQRGYETLTNTKLMNFDTKDFRSDRGLNTINSNTKNYPTSWRNKDNETATMKEEKDNVKRDLDYVKTLDTWEKSFLPKINK